MGDKDGQDLNREVYESLFSENAQGVRCYEIVAKALRDATKTHGERGGITIALGGFMHYHA